MLCAAPLQPAPGHLIASSLTLPPSPRSTLTSLLYPLYASYKALRPPASVGATPQEQHAQLERWCMFWCVLAIVGVWEEWAEWSVSW